MWILYHVWYVKDINSIIHTNNSLWCVLQMVNIGISILIYICFRPGNPTPGMKSDQVVDSLVGFYISVYNSCICFMKFYPLNHTMFLTFSVPHDRLGLMLFVCSWCDKNKFILPYLRYTWFYLTSGVCSLMKLAAMEKTDAISHPNPHSHVITNNWGTAYHSKFTDTIQLQDIYSDILSRSDIS